MRRVQYVDLTGPNLFRQMLKRIDAHGGQLVYANVSESAATGRKMGKLLRPMTLKGKEIVFTVGEPGNALYFILHGQVEMRLPTSRHRYKRLAKLGPGSFFGEAAFLDRGLRAAEAVVSHDAELVVLDRDAIESLAEKRLREAGLALLYELGASLVRQLRWTLSELRRLERW